MKITPLGDRALLLELGDAIDEPTRKRVQATWRTLTAAPLPAVSETVPAYTSVTVYYEPAQAVQAGAPEAGIAEWVADAVRERLKRPPKVEAAKPRRVEVPVCYAPDYGPDLPRVAAQAKLSVEEVVRRHERAKYVVHLIGFTPGFPYLGGLPKELATPRHAKPRMAVPAGSVAIAGPQAGIYPQVTPGGWNLIGRTPLRLFRPERDPAVILRAGDEVVFRAIAPAEFDQLATRE